MPDFVTLLDRSPGWLRRMAYRVAAGRGTLGKLADAARFRFVPEDVPEPPSRELEMIRLLIGPANSAGQAYLWARAIEDQVAGASAVSMRGLGGDTFGAAVDLRVPVAVYQRSSEWHSRFERYLEDCTHIVWESGLPLLGRAFGSDASTEIARLGRNGVRAALMFHGSDIRLPSWHRERSPWSPFQDRRGPIRALEETASTNLRLARDAGVPTFVSTPDLLGLLPDATWCPVVVDPQRWRSERYAPLSRGRPPVVAHAPSRGWLKGTDHIEPMLMRLSREGVIDYRRATGVLHDAMPEFYAESDIVLDQFLVGSYGVAACEAMAAGRIVMGHVDSDTRARVKELTGLELPVHEATIHSLETELRRAASEPESLDTLRESGPAFVDSVHSGRRSAGAFARFLGVSA